MENLLNDIASLGLPSKTTAYVHTPNGTKEVEIDVFPVNFTPQQLEALQEKFNDEVRVMEFTRGNTYKFNLRNRLGQPSPFAKSSSLEELWEMYKADAMGQKIPERKCFFLKTPSRK